MAQHWLYIGQYRFYIDHWLIRMTVLWSKFSSVFIRTCNMSASGTLTFQSNDLRTQLLSDSDVWVEDYDVSQKQKLSNFLFLLIVEPASALGNSTLKTKWSTRSQDGKNASGGIPCLAWKYKHSRVLHKHTLKHMAEHKFINLVSITYYLVNIVFY